MAQLNTGRHYHACCSF